MTDEIQRCTQAVPRPDLPARLTYHPEAAYEEDEYGSLAEGGSYEVWRCPHCLKKIYLMLPD